MSFFCLYLLTTAAFGQAVDPQVHIQQAVAALRGKSYAQAAEHAGQAIASGHETAGAYNVRSAARSHLGDFSGALADAERALALNPRSASAYGNRAAARAGLKAALSDVLSDLERAAQIDPAYRARYEALAGSPKAAPAAAAPKPVPAAAAPTPVPVAAAPVPRPISSPEAPAPIEAPASDSLSPEHLAAGLAAGLIAVLFYALKHLKTHRLTRVRFGSVISFGEPVETLPAGAVMGGRYIAGRLIAKQDDLEVYEARDLEDQPRLLKRVTVADAAALATALARAQQAAALRHPTAERVEAVFQDDRHVYLACAAPTDAPRAS